MATKEKMITKSYGIKMIKPVASNGNDDNWDNIGKHLNDLNYIIPRVKNKAATDTLFYIREKLNWEAENGKDKEYFKKKLGKTLPAHLMYECVRDKNLKGIENFHAENVKTACNNACSSTNSKTKNILTGKESLTSYKNNQPIPMLKRFTKVIEEDGEYYVELAIFSTAKAKELGRITRRASYVRFLLSSKGNEKVILKRLINGEYQLCDSNIQKQGKSWVFIVSHKFIPQNKVELNPDKVLGIDLGISKAAYMAVSDSPKNRYIDGGEIESFRKRIEARRKSIRNQLRVCSDNRRGHGRKCLMKPLDTLSDKVSNFRKLTNHRYAKEIVRYAIENQCSTIQMEDLSGISKDNNFLANWSYFDLQLKIEDKANEVGIRVNKVNPKYTSQRCYKCGTINPDNRKSQAVYECDCGYKTNADLNAARNLSVLGIEKIIKEQAKSQKI